MTSSAQAPSLTASMVLLSTLSAPFVRPHVLYVRDLYSSISMNGIHAVWASFSDLTP